jgi:3-deoxy-D-manno-octulosonic-acid transferase
MYLFYSALLALALLISSPWWLLQIAIRRKYRAGLGERLGFVPARLQPRTDEQCVIWIHAVSVGEVLAITGIAEQLKQAHPRLRVVFSSTTAAGQKLARQRFGGENVFFFPLDFGFCVGPYLRAVQPDLVVLAETEFWPNFVRLARGSGAHLAVVNARISNRSFPRYRRWRSVLEGVLAHIDVFCAQTEEDARRLREIGASPERVTIVGNLKFDATPPACLPVVEQLRTAIQRGGAGPVIVCGSTVEGEEAMALDAFSVYRRDRKPKALLVLAPRHPERFAAAASEVEKRELPLVRRSQWNGGPLGGGVFLLDSIGELAAVYVLADVAFVGGSLVPMGGHNILEPAFFGKAIVVGPHTDNFRDVVEQFASANAVMVAQDFDTVLHLADDARTAAELGARTTRVLQENAGATQRTLQSLLELLPATAIAQEQRP